MNITSGELYYALKVAYQQMKDRPEDFSTVQKALENVEKSAEDLLKMYQGIILSYRMNKEKTE
jgi:hypothetical protein